MDPINHSKTAYQILTDEALREEDKVYGEAVEKPGRFINFPKFDRLEGYGQRDAILGFAD